MEYKITEVLNTRPNVYQGMTGVDFKVEGNDNKISALTKDSGVFSVGATISGEIKPKEKDGKVFYNFYEGRSGGGQRGGTNPELIRKLDQIITELAILKPMIRDIHSWKTSEGKPQPFEDDPLEGVF